MTSLVTLGGILLMLGFAFWWAVRTGKRLNQAEALKERVDKVANVNEFNRREDEEVNRQYKTQGITLALCLLLGCVSGISGKELFPILFKRALDFHLMKAQSRLR